VGTREAIGLGIIGSATEAGESSSVDVLLLALEFRLVVYCLYGNDGKPSDMVRLLGWAKLKEECYAITKGFCGNTQLLSQRLCSEEIFEWGREESECSKEARHRT
jgi:hypothetical protein